MAILFYSESDKPFEWKRAFSKLAPDLDFYVWPDCKKLDEVEVALVWNPPIGMINNCPNLRLIASLGAGVDHLFKNFSSSHVPITRIVDETLTEQMVEYVVMATLFCHRSMPKYLHQQKQSNWTQILQPLGRDCTVGIMGLGVLGGAVSYALKGLNFNVRGWSRSHKSLDGVKTYSSLEELDQFLDGTNILICLLPLTPETVKIIDAKLLKKLPKGSYVINAGRGAQLVEQDLIEALDEEHISHAFLDVVCSEPLPENNPLWSHSKVTLTPHIASITNPFSSASIIIDNLIRVRSGKRPLYEVNSEKGY